MRNYLRAGLAFLAIGAEISSFATGGSGTGNGGGFARNAYIQEGQEFIRYLEKTLEGQAFVRTHSIDIKLLKSCLREEAISPVPGPLRDNRGDLVDALSELGKTQIDKDIWTQFVLQGRSLTTNVRHEMLRCAGKDDDGLKLLSQLVVPGDRGHWEEALQLHRGTVLAEHDYGNTRSGFLSPAAAEEYCRTMRAQYSAQYFLVICEFHQKEWREEEEGLGFYQRTERVGYSTQIESQFKSRSGQVDVAEQRKRIFSHKSSQFHAQGAEAEGYYFYSEVPQLVKNPVPYKYSYWSQNRVWGIRIVGLGARHQLTWKRIFASPRNFASEDLAYRACRSVMVEVQTSKQTSDEDLFKYYQAECFPVPRDDKRFTFEIRTQNPFVQHI